MAPPPARALVWFRRDLRIGDNPALTAALATGLPVIALHVDEGEHAARPLGAAARWWRDRTLETLARDLAALGIPLILRHGLAKEMVTEIADAHGATHLFWNRCYLAGEHERDAAIKTAERQRGRTVESFAASLLIEPFAIATKSGTPFSVFTPFWRALRQTPIASPLSAPAATLPPVAPPSLDLPEPFWARPFHTHWTAGEAAARDLLTAFLDNRLARYAADRNRPDLDATSRLSPYLAVGAISPRQVWAATMAHLYRHPAEASAGEKFLSELAWRDFAWHIAYHHPNLATAPLQQRFAALDWTRRDDWQAAWQQGRTGIPMVDAGMRELWQTGVMHNRVRMLAASFFTKNLWQDWRDGERWFWDTLIDADAASNPFGWQWVAGCGADAAPYFRIFNPVTQGEKFDPDGAYVARYVPELASLPMPHRQRPFDAPPLVLATAGIRLGQTYPAPLVDLKHSFAAAQARFKALKT